MTTPGGLYPVCCAADIPAKFMNRFIQQNQDNGDQTDCLVVFVDSLDTVYTEQSEIGFEEASSSASPFKGKTPAECRDLLVQLRREGSYLDYDRFVIADERSLQDDTVLLAVGELSESEGLTTMRAITREASLRLAVYLVGIADIREDKVVAEANGGVWTG